METIPHTCKQSLKHTRDKSQNRVMIIIVIDCGALSVALVSHLSGSTTNFFSDTFRELQHLNSRHVDHCAVASCPQDAFRCCQVVVVHSSYTTRPPYGLSLAPNDSVAHGPGFYQQLRGGICHGGCHSTDDFLSSCTGRLAMHHSSLEGC